MIDPATSLRTALAEGARLLAEAGVEDPRHEARRVLMAALDMDLTALVLREAEPLGEKAAQATAFFTRRAAREPLSRILGLREFRGLDLALGSETLDPRPDTEVLVEAALAALPMDKPLDVLDLGTGSGAILLALLHARPLARGTGIDIAPQTVRIAQQNAHQLGLMTRATFLAGDLFTPLKPEERFNAILSNPPYIPSAVLPTLDPEVRLFDPARALDGGEDGLVFYRRITNEAAKHLVSGGFLAFEVGIGQAEAVAALMQEAGFGGIIITPDLSGIARVVTGLLPESPSSG